jgi:hypothetical protein
MTVHLDESIITGTRAMSGSDATGSGSAPSPPRVEHALVHVDVDDLRAALDLLARDVERRLVVAAEDQLARTSPSR